MKVCLLPKVMDIDRECVPAGCWRAYLGQRRMKSTTVTAQSRHVMFCVSRMSVAARRHVRLLCCPVWIEALWWRSPGWGFLPTVYTKLDFASPEDGQVLTRIWSVSRISNRKL